MDISKLTLEEKVDMLLKYQINAHRWAVIKTVVYVLLFVIFIVIPMVGLYYLYTSIDFGGITNAYQNIQQTSGGLDKINELIDSIQY
ncbi:hypothetical protein JW758_05005 [Candidatus Peregrinibacteria bacterium]|nr:hypothetical protein [Candidatus Peregrinibacteria bacterium]